MALLLGILIGSETEAAFAVYATLRTGRAQNDALRAAAKTALDTQAHDLFLAILRIHDTVEKHRTALAHGCLGYAEKLPEAITWVESKHVMHWSIGMLKKDIDHKPEDWDEIGALSRNSTVLTRALV